MKTRAGAIIWGFIILGLLAFVAARVVRGNVVDSGLLALFPSSEQDPLLKKANTLLSQRTSHLLVFLVGHSNPVVAEEFGQRLKTELKESGYIQSFLSDISPEQQKAIYEIYFPYRYQMLSPYDRRLLKERDSSAYFLRRLKGNLYSPAATSLKMIIPQDPLLFFPELVRSWMAAIPSQSERQNGEGIIFVDPDGVSYSFVGVELSLDPFHLKDQDRMMSWLSQLRKKFITEQPALRLYSTGVLPFAVSERIRSEREMTMITVGSLIGVALLVAWIFFSVRPFFLSILPIAVGFLAAIAATLAVFGKIHIITWAFGTTLIGVAVDYPLNYLAHYRMSSDKWHALNTMKKIFPGLVLGALTTVMGYAALSLAPLPGLRQMALFSSVGLIAALTTVICWMPSLLKRPSTRRPQPQILSLGQNLIVGWAERWNKGQRIRFWSAGIVLSIIIIGGLSQIKFDDDIRRLQRPPEALAREDAFIQQAIKGWGTPRFFLVQGSNEEELLIRQEKLNDELLRLKEKGDLVSVQSLAPFLPSRQKQDDDNQLLQKAILPQSDLYRRKLKEIGFSAPVANNLLKDVKKPLSYLSIDTWLKSPASEKLRSLWIGPVEKGVASAVMVSGFGNANALSQILKECSGVKYLDQFAEYSQLLRQIRRQSVRLMMLAYLGVWLLMMARYGIKTGTLVTAPSVAAVLMVFAGYGFAGVPLHLIHCLSALLVLSMGIDYSIYFAECARWEFPAGPTLLAVGLCAATTFISFGFLALCRTPILSSIGITVFFGMFIAFIFSPLPYVMRSIHRGSHE